MYSILNQNTQEAKIESFLIPTEWDRGLCYRLDKTMCEFSSYYVAFKSDKRTNRLKNPRKDKKNLAECHCWRSQLKSFLPRQRMKRMLERTTYNLFFYFFIIFVKKNCLHVFVIRYLKIRRYQLVLALCDIVHKDNIEETIFRNLSGRL